MHSQTRIRDPRLDFFRGIAMFIILFAHIPGNWWTLWIPARFGWSDATEIFVFCSGMASAIAFGGAFARKGWWLGTARVAFRIWQVYWA
ncbi:MAG: OpgC domain-containing protein, partial [Mangrovicoccus sp.]